MTLSGSALSRGKRRRAVKRNRLETKKSFIAAALDSKKKVTSISNYGAALGDFKEMEEAISGTKPEGKAHEPNTVRKTIHKHKTHGALKRSQKLRSDKIDVERCRTLMSIPEFASDPITAMEKHLLRQKQNRDAKSAKRDSIRMDVS